jgi:hypothetical protein
MNPIRFAQCNCVMLAPKDLPECYDLHTFKGQTPQGQAVVISAWKPTPEELVNINLGEPIWLFLWGEIMQPAAIVLDNPFDPITPTVD